MSYIIFTQLYLGAVRLIWLMDNNRKPNQLEF